MENTVQMYQDADVNRSPGPELVVVKISKVPVRKVHTRPEYFGNLPRSTEEKDNEFVFYIRIHKDQVHKSIKDNMYGRQD